MSRTKIEWVKGPDGVQGQTWNPTTGCHKVSPGCLHCYAEREARGRLKGSKGYPGLPWTKANAAKNVFFHEDRLDIPRRRKIPTVYFVNSMSDLFHDLVTDAQIKSIVDVARITERHVYIISTKRAARAQRYVAAHGPLPDNVWLLHSVEDQPTAESRIPHLLNTRAKVRGLSCEPLLAGVDLTPWLGDPRLHWVICGGESGPGRRRFDLNWARSLRDQCVRAGVPFFFKQVDKVTRIPDDLTIRQMPWDVAA